MFLSFSVEVDDVGETSENKAASSVQPKTSLLSDLPTVSRQADGTVVLCFVWTIPVKVSDMKKYAT